MRLDVVYHCQSCGAVSVDSRAVGANGTGGFDLSPICECDQSQVVSSMELHTRDEGD